jgi:hypothetical protein
MGFVLMPDAKITSDFYAIGTYSTSAGTTPVETIDTTRDTSIFLQPNEIDVIRQILQGLREKGLYYSNDYLELGRFTGTQYNNRFPPITIDTSPMKPGEVLTSDLIRVEDQSKREIKRLEGLLDQMRIVFEQQSNLVHDLKSRINQLENQLLHANPDWGKY